MREGQGVYKRTTAPVDPATKRAQRHQRFSYQTRDKEVTPSDNLKIQITNPKAKKANPRLTKTITNDVPDSPLTRESATQLVQDILIKALPQVLNLAAAPQVPVQPLFQPQPVAVPHIIVQTQVRS